MSRPPPRVPRRWCSYLQTALICFATIGCTCCSAVMICFVGSGYDWSPAGTLICATVKYPSARLSDVQSLFAAPAWSATYPAVNADAPIKNFAVGDAVKLSEYARYLMATSSVSTFLLALPFLYQMLPCVNANLAAVDRPLVSAAAARCSAQSVLSFCP